MKELTIVEAHDLAQHFLGREWYARERGGVYMLGQVEAGVVHTGDSWRSVFRQANVHLPTRSDFEYKGKNVRARKTNRVVAMCDSNTMAQRVANALNEYQPGPRGY